MKVFRKGIGIRANRQPAVDATLAGKNPEQMVSEYVSWDVDPVQESVDNRPRHEVADTHKPVYEGCNDHRAFDLTDIGITGQH
jgi:hypothetical protein